MTMLYRKTIFYLNRNPLIVDKHTKLLRRAIWWMVTRIFSPPRGAPYYFYVTVKVCLGVPT